MKFLAFFVLSGAHPSEAFPEVIQYIPAHRVPGMCQALFRVWAMTHTHCTLMEIIVTKSSSLDSRGVIYSLKTESGLLKLVVLLSKLLGLHADISSWVCLSEHLLALLL